MHNYVYCNLLAVKAYACTITLHYIISHAMFIMYFFFFPTNKVSKH